MKQTSGSSSCGVRTLCFRLLVVAAGGLTSVVAWAQAAYPSKPITLIVPFAPGGAQDVAGRQIAIGLSQALRQPVIVENRSGSGGSAGLVALAKALPDGYTLGMASSSLTINAVIQAKPSYDPIKSFTPIAVLSKFPYVVAVNNDVPVHNAAELVAYLKSRPGKLNYGSPGVGTASHFATAMLLSMSNADAVHVPSRGLGPAVTDLIGGHLQMLIASGPSLMPHAQSGRIRAVAITSEKPSLVAPDLVPVATAIPGFQFEAWGGVLAPAGTPAEIVNLLNAEINKLVRRPEMKEFFKLQGAELTTSTPADLADIIAAEMPRWRNLVRLHEIKAE